MSASHPSYGALHVVRSSSAKRTRPLANASRGVPPPPPPPAARRGVPIKAQGAANPTVMSIRHEEAIFRSKLQSLMSVRQQIEELASKHRVEEEALSRALQHLLAIDQSDKTRTRQELEQSVAERDKAIEMLEIFRKEGNAVIKRLHEGLRSSTAQCEEHLQTIAALNREVAEYRAHFETKAADGASSDYIDAMEKRCSEYATLLKEADEVVVALRADNERLRAATGTSAPAASSPSQEVEQLRDALRNERRQRLEAEEQAHKMMMEQQRNTQLLEQRLAAALSSGSASARTPRTPTSVHRNRRASASEEGSEPSTLPQPPLPASVVVESVTSPAVNPPEEESMQELLDIERQLKEVQRALETPR